MDILAIAFFLALVNKALLDYISAPVRKKFPSVDLWWFDYLGLATGALIAWFAPLNILGDYVANETLARVLTALMVGGGAALINDVFTGAQGRDEWVGAAPFGEPQKMRRRKGW